MPAVLIIFPDVLLSKVDAMVREAKTEKVAAFGTKVTDIERHEAIKIGNKKGQAAANEYLRALQASRTPPRISRTSVLIKLIEAGIKLEEDAASKQ